MENVRKQTVGWIGLGSQGGPMARRIAEHGFALILWARRPEALAAFADVKAEHAASIADLGARADLVCVCVVDDEGVTQVVGALLPAMRKGSRLALHSTIHPDTCVKLARQAAAHGIALIDAPVSGGGPAAAAGALTVMVGGEADAVAASRPVFGSFSSNIVHLGEVGAGQRAKLVNNALMAANMALADAALGAGARLGIDRAALIDLIKASSGRSYSFDVRARMSDATQFGHGAKLLAKDVGLLGDLLAIDPNFATMRDAAQPFLDRAMRAASQQVTS